MEAFSIELTPQIPGNPGTPGSGPYLKPAQTPPPIKNHDSTVTTYYHPRGNVVLNSFLFHRIARVGESVSLAVWGGHDLCSLTSVQL